MPSFHFSSKNDSRFLKERIAEKHRLIYSPRQWLIHNDSITTNLYGDPGVPITGTDGQTSAPSSREFTSLSSNFEASGVKVNDTLEIFNQPCATSTSSNFDNGLYKITNVATNVLTIDQDWPHGNQDNLDFSIQILNERYTKLDQLIPFMVKLNPTQKTLDKWGITENRDAIVELSSLLCEEASLTPKIGDRFLYNYGDREIHYELKNLFQSDQLGDSGDFLSYIGFAKKTTNKLGV